MATLGKYELLGRIAMGGMGELHLARQSGPEGFSKLVVIKRLHQQFVYDEALVRMFVDEARIAARLSHANIAQIYDLGASGTDYFIAMEYVRGKNLKEIQDRGTALGTTIPIPMAAYVISKVCRGLNYAHALKDEQGQPLKLVHRDISHQNILLNSDGEVKLVDFGIAKATSRAAETQAGLLRGRAAYMSPEQCRQRPVDARSDIFSVGVVLYELVCRRRLFRRHSDFATMRAVSEDPIPPPSAVVPEVPASLEKVIFKALERNPRNRYKSAQDMHADLDHVIRELGWRFAEADAAAFLNGLFHGELDVQIPGTTGAAGPPVREEETAHDPQVIEVIQATFAPEEGTVPGIPRPRAVPANATPGPAWERPRSVALRPKAALAPLPAVAAAEDAGRLAAEVDETSVPDRTRVARPSFDDVELDAPPPPGEDTSPGFTDEATTMSRLSLGNRALVADRAPHPDHAIAPAAGPLVLAQPALPGGAQDAPSAGMPDRPGVSVDFTVDPDPDTDQLPPSAVNTRKAPFSRGKPPIGANPHPAPAPLPPQPAGTNGARARLAHPSGSPAALALVPARGRGEDDLRPALAPSSLPADAHDDDDDNDEQTRQAAPPAGVAGPRSDQGRPAAPPPGGLSLVPPATAPEPAAPVAPVRDRFKADDEASPANPHPVLPPEMLSSYSGDSEEIPLEGALGPESSLPTMSVAVLAALGKPRSKWMLLAVGAAGLSLIIGLSSAIWIIAGRGGASPRELRVDSDPPGASVVIGGHGLPLGTTPLTLRGLSKDRPHDVSLTLPGYTRWQGQVEVQASGGATRLFVKLNHQVPKPTAEGESIPGTQALSVGSK